MGDCYDTKRQHIGQTYISFSAVQITLITQGHCSPHIWTPGMSHLKRCLQREVSVLFRYSNVSSLLGSPVKHIREANKTALEQSCKFPQAEGLKEIGPGQNDLRHLPTRRTLLLRMFYSLPRLPPWQASVVWQLGVVGGQFCGLAAYFNLQLWEWALTRC